jgi:hypothetical protein
MYGAIPPFPDTSSWSGNYLIIIIIIIIIIINGTEILGAVTIFWDKTPKSRVEFDCIFG